jgi:hypothetical protein
VEAGDAFPLIDMDKSIVVIFIGKLSIVIGIDVDELVYPGAVKHSRKYWIFVLIRL